MVGKAGGRQPQAPINWPSSQSSPEMKGCVHRLGAQAAFVRGWNMRPRHRGFSHRGMAPDGFVWPVSPWVTVETMVPRLTQWAGRSAYDSWCALQSQVSTMHSFY